jgi:hypothetical protein
LKAKIKALFSWILDYWKPIGVISASILLIVYLAIEHGKLEITPMQYQHIIERTYFYSECCPEYSAQVAEFMRDKIINTVENAKLRELEEDIELFRIKGRLQQ